MVRSILLTLSTSSPTLSKSGKHTFSITLQATTDTDGEAVVIDPFLTMLSPAMAVFYHQGFTFEDVTTTCTTAATATAATVAGGGWANFAERNELHVNYLRPQDLSGGCGMIPNSELVEIPPRNYSRQSPPFSVTHTMKIRRTPSPTSYSARRPEGLVVDQTEAEQEDLQRLFSQAADESVGFEVGRSYEIGLGKFWDKVQWWRLGEKDEVFRETKKLEANNRVGNEKLPLVLMNRVVFEVVE